MGKCDLLLSDLKRRRVVCVSVRNQGEKRREEFRSGMNFGRKRTSVCVRKESIGAVGKVTRIR